MQAESDACSIAEDDYAAEQGWDYGCDYQVLYRFFDPVTLAELREHSELSEWSPLRAQFRRKVYGVDPQDWEKLIEAAAKKNPDFREFIGQVSEQPIGPTILRMEQLEDALVDNLSLLAPGGFDLELYTDPSGGGSGRQLVCTGDGGRIDLLCYDRRRNQYVVIELKNVRAGRAVFAQICSYMGWVESRIAMNKPVIGLVISRGTDPKCESARKVTESVQQINLADIGFEQTSRRQTPSREQPEWTTSIDTANILSNAVERSGSTTWPIS